MPLDALTVSALARELDEALRGAKIEKIQQPERDIILLSVRSEGQNRRLLMAAGTGNARVHFTKQSYENPKDAPMFCMLLRKHLTGGRILSVTQPGLERMLMLELTVRDEMGYDSKRSLAVELIGRSANIVLIGADGRIIDCIHRMDFAGGTGRALQPGMIYRLPPKQDKRDIMECDSQTVERLCAAADRDGAMDKWLLSTFSGLSPLICRELAYRCGESYRNLPAMIDALKESIRAGEQEPVMVCVDDKPLDFTFMPLHQYGSGGEMRRYDDFPQLLDEYYGQREQMELRRRHSHELTKSVRTARDRMARKLGEQKKELERTESMEDVRRNAELVTANIYRMKRGDRLLECDNYYEPDCPKISIPLDPLKTPQENSAAMFKEYNKLKGAKKHLTVLVAQGEEQLDYLNSVLDQLSRAETGKDLSDIRRELLETGYIRRRGGKQEKTKPQEPLRFATRRGLEVLVGRSNAQNDELTGKLARRTDYWFHAQKIHGSHVILRCENLEPDEDSILDAATLAAYYSQGRDGGKIAVDYTMVRNVKKPSGAMPGKVIYTEYKTLMAQSDDISHLKKI